MKRLHIGLSLAALAALALLAGCDARLPGQPTEAERWRAPAEVSDFNQLYTQNCAGCHGAGGRRGAARSLNDPLYLAFVTDAELRQVVAHGRPGTNMPAFSQHEGGGLTDRQIELLTSGMRAQWARPDDFRGVEIPPYNADGTAAGSNVDVTTASADPGVASTPYDTQRGAAAYQTYCASCHGTNGAGGRAGSIVDPNFLRLVSDQGLRTTVVVGRSDLGKPDWRSNLPGHPMSPREIDDVVAWLASHRLESDTAISESNQSSRLSQQ
jgi:cytochrome c oxidase cbb3-type subunit III